MKKILVRYGLLALMFGLLYGAHDLMHDGWSFIGGALGGIGFCVAEIVIRRDR